MYSCSHGKPTFCNVCREMLSGTSKGLSCEGMNNDVEFICLWEKTQLAGAFFMPLLNCIESSKC